MARSDLLISLVKASMTGDTTAVKSVVERIIAEENSKQHRVLANRLSQALRTNGNGTYFSRPPADAAKGGREFVAEYTPHRRLEDLILSDKCRGAVDQFIEEQQRQDLLRSHGLNPRHRILLVGPPGNGKTSLAEAIAEALAVPFFVVRYEAMIGSYLGETATRLNRVFEYVRTTPCVLFFDEFDAIGKERGDTHETGEIKRVVTSLLMHVDSLPCYTIVIAATNHPELLDRAVWRRFQLRLNLPAPTQSEIAHYIGRNLSKLNDFSISSAKAIAKKLGPISYAEAEEFVMDVRRRDVLAMGERYSKDLLEMQLDQWEMRSQAKPTHTSEKFE